MKHLFLRKEKKDGLRKGQTMILCMTKSSKSDFYVWKKIFKDPKELVKCRG